MISPHYIYFLWIEEIVYKSLILNLVNVFLLMLVKLISHWSAYNLHSKSNSFIYKIMEIHQGWLFTILPLFLCIHIWNISIWSSINFPHQSFWPVFHFSCILNRLQHFLHMSQYTHPAIHYYITSNKQSWPKCIQYAKRMCAFL